MELLIFVTEERFSGNNPHAYLYWFKGLKSEEQLLWERIVLYQGYSLNNLDIGDIDNDGNIDIITAEHKGEESKTLIFHNEVDGRFSTIHVDTAIEGHLGTKLYDLDNDGDLDIVSITWDQPEFLYL